MKTFAITCSRKLLALGVVGVIVVGFLLASLNLTLPFADQLRAPLERSLSRALGVDVTIGRISARWTGSGPRVLFLDTELADPLDPDQRIHVGELRLDLAMFASLREWHPRFEQIVLRDTEFTLFQYRDGRFSISGLKRPGSGSLRAMALFESLPNLLLEDTRVHWRREVADYRDMPLHLARAQLRNLAGRHLIDARIDLATRRAQPAGEAQLRLVLDVRGHSGRAGGLDGRVYAQARRFPLAKVLQARMPAGARLGGRLSGELWGDLRAGRVARFDARLRGIGASLSTTPDSAPLALRGEYALRWTGGDRDWRLDLMARSPNGPILPRRAALAYRAGEGYRLFADRVGLAALARWLQRVANERVERWLAAAKPAGQMMEVRAHFAEDGQWRVVSRLEQLRLEAVGKIPGIARIDAILDATPKRIEARLHGVDVELDSGGLFRAPLSFSIDGRLRLERHEDVLLLDSDDLHIRNPDLDSDVALRVELPGKGPPLLDIVGRFRNGEAAHAKRYFPARVMKPRLLSWLDQAFVRGRVPSGGFLFVGSPRHFPFDKTLDGRFQVLFDVEEMELHFLKNWPDLEGLAARVEFLDNRLRIERGRARLQRIALTDVALNIHPLRHATGMQLRGHARGDLREALALLRPRLKRQGYLASIDPSGPAEAGLRLSIPLGAHAKEHPVRIVAELRLHDDRLRIGKNAAGLEAISGRLRIDGDGIQGSGLRARWRGNPLVVDIERPAGGGTRILARATLEAASLGAAIAANAKGKARVRAEMELPAVGKGHPRLEIDSDLRGIALDLPPPFGKPRIIARPLELWVELESAQRQHITARLGDLLWAETQLDATREGWRPRWVRARLGKGGPASGGPRAGIHLSGRLAELDIARWRDWLARQPLPGDGEALVDELGVKIRVDRLRSPLGSWRDVAIEGGYHPGSPPGWSLKLAGDGLRGGLSRAGRGPVTITFSRLRLDPDSEGPSPKGAGIRPESLPPFEIRIGELALGKHRLGHATLRARHTRGGLRFENLRLEDEDTRILGDGLWVHRDAGEHSEMHLELHLKRLGRFLRDTGISDKVRDGGADLGLRLGWRGGPGDFAIERLDGEADIALRKARFIGVKPGVAKLLGLVSLDAIGRRLRLKFDDVLKQGLYVDEAKGKVRIAGGRLSTRGFAVTGPIGRVTLDGWLDLKPPQPMNLLATVVPEFGSTLTVAGAVAGGPVVGAALMLARNLLKKQVDAASTLRFRLEGTLDKPLTRVLTPPRAPHGDVSDIHNYDEDAEMR